MPSVVMLSVVAPYKPAYANASLKDLKLRLEPNFPHAKICSKLVHFAWLKKFVYLIQLSMLVVGAKDCYHGCMFAS